MVGGHAQHLAYGGQPVYAHGPAPVAVAAPAYAPAPVAVAKVAKGLWTKR